jgi:hypothetical protein
MIRGSDLPGSGCAGYSNEGVGEHVRIRFHLAAIRPDEIADHRSAPNEENLTKKTCFFCRTGFPGANSAKDDPAV